jgi:transglutaminase-like putative cysteine protease
MNRYHLLHVTAFHYDRPVSESYNEVRLRPLHDEKQSCLSFRLTTTPSSRSISYCDAFGNRVHQFNIPGEHRVLTIEAESVVLTHETAGPVAAGGSLASLDANREEIFEEFYDFVCSSAYVPYLPQLREFAHEAEQASDGSVEDFAVAATSLVHERFTYTKGATHVQSSAADALAAGAGVCQDFAHVLLGVARSRGVAARYVSGYITPESISGDGARMGEVIGGQASHAWVEVYAPGTEWLGFDPTLGGRTGLRHIRLAYGRDYSDVAPVRGVHKGLAGQRLSVDVRVRPALDDVGHEQVRESAVCGGPEPAISERLQQPPQQQ